MTNFASRLKILLLLPLFVSLFCSQGVKAQTAIAITSITPDSIAKGSAEFTLTVNGSGFSGGLAGSGVRWNGKLLTTTIVSDIKATAIVPAANIAVPQTATITFVKSLGTAAFSSNAVTFWVLAPLNTMSPTFAMSGDNGFTLVLNGDFSSMADPIVQWNGSNRTTTSVSRFQVTAAISAEDILTAKTVAVRVYSGIPYSNYPSLATNTLNFTVDPALAMQSLNPHTVAAGNPTFPLTITGTGFRSEYGSRVLWNGQERTSTINSTTQITATIPAADVAAMGTAAITVTNLYQKRTSNTMYFSVTAPTPIISSLSPSSALAGAQGFTLTVNGSNFLAPFAGTTSSQGSVVRWNGVNRSTTFVNSTRLTAVIPAGDLASAALVDVTVSNEAAGGAVSRASVFTVNNPTPVITSISPVRILPGSGPLYLIVNGTGFVSSSVVRFQGSSRSTTLVSSTRLQALLPATDFTASGPASITVFNPSPGGGTSESTIFTVLPAVPTFTLTGLPASLDSAQQQAVGISIDKAYPVNITGQLTLSFTPDAVNPVNDAAIQFISGGRTVSFTIPASSTQAVFGSSAVTATFQTGTVAGTIALSVGAQTEGVTLSLTPDPNRSFVISRKIPKIVSAVIANKTATGFEVQITAYSASRSLSQVAFQFTGSGSGNLSNTSFSSNISSLMTTWFQSAESAAYGSQFKLTVPFTVNGNIGAIGSVAVTLTNETGTSAETRVTF